jgi:hypothetical protein
MFNIVYTVFVIYWLAEGKHRTVEKLEIINNHELYFDEYFTVYTVPIQFNRITQYDKMKI